MAPDYPENQGNHKTMLTCPYVVVIFSISVQKLATASVGPLI